MLIAEYLFIPVFRRTARIEQETRGVNECDFIRYFPSFVDEQIVNRFCKVGIVARVVKVLIVRRIANDKIELHRSPPCIYPTILQSTLSPPVIDAHRRYLSRMRGEQSEFLDLLGQIKEHQLHRLTLLGIGNRPANPVHLPEIPRYRADDGAILLRCRLPPPACAQILLERHEEIDARNEEVIPLELVAIRRLIGAQCPPHPFRFIRDILAHDAQFAVKNALPLRERYALHRRDIIAVHEIGRLAAGDLQPPRIDIVLPLSAAWKTDARGQHTVHHKWIHTAKVRGIRIADHLPTDGEGREHLGMATRALRLLFHLLACPRLDHIRVLSRNQGRQDLLCPLVRKTEGTIGVRRPNDIPFGRLIREKRGKEALRVQPQNLILYSDEQDTPPFPVLSRMIYYSI